jgi:uncharacterized protein (TIGR03435 family)
MYDRGIAMFKLLLRASLLIILVFPAITFSQQPNGATKTFDTVSIKQVAVPPPGPPGGLTLAVKKEDCKYLPSRVICQLSLLELIETAYQINNDSQIAAPEWMGDQAHTFRVQATMPLRTSEADARSMLRKALAERFALKTHWEDRKITAYVLLVAKTGARLQEVRDDKDIKRRNMDTPSGSVQATSIGSPGRFYASGITLDGLAEELRYRGGLDRPVINMTNLEGRYTVDLHWTPDSSEGRAPSAADAAFVSAVKDQLGLRLDKKSVSAKILVADSANKSPTPD